MPRSAPWAIIFNHQCYKARTYCRNTLIYCLLSPNASQIMTPPSLPFPRTTAALARLNPRQLDFCHRIMAGEYAVRAYAAVWGHTQSGCPRKMAAKIKSGHAVSEYLAARYEELCVRDRISREAGMLAITEWRTAIRREANELTNDLNGAGESRR